MGYLQVYKAVLFGLETVALRRRAGLLLHSKDGWKQE